MRYHSLDSAFTLIELLVVIAIIAILAVVVVLTLNPAELLRQSRDADRVSDMATLTSAINLYSADQSGAPSYSLGTPSTTYFSFYDPAATSSVGTNCATAGLFQQPYGWSYQCPASSTLRNVNNTGWIPVNFSGISSGSPFGALPIDPSDSSSSHLYYTYTTNGSMNLPPRWSRKNINSAARTMWNRMMAARTLIFLRKEPIFRLNRSIMDYPRDSPATGR